ncbi:MAG: hypothetical protein ACREU2_05220 [Steroidobacteraceae bacterium]
MKRKPQRLKAAPKASHAIKHGKRTTRSVKPVKSGKPGRSNSQLERVLALVKAHPGIRPSELNRRLNVEQSDGLRNTLIKRGLIRKEKDGSAMRYYPV